MRENVKAKKNTVKEKLLSGREIDISIIFIAIFLSVFCLVFVYSALAFEEGASKTILKVLTLKSSDRTLIKTIVYIIVGIAGMTVFACCSALFYASGSVAFTPWIFTSSWAWGVSRSMVGISPSTFSTSQSICRIWGGVSTSPS